ncbi:aliphatic sulfonate ABC transporter substrate-binding protein [Anaerostipes sp.]|uniref:taurine ABC transporter substrate-binding protein n=1 Tax=Anaerostipes sp. TaxID=1872530 RepID=UPI003967BAB9
MKERKLSIREIIVLLIATILLISATACRASKADQTKENKKVKEIKIGTMDLVNPDLVARKEKYYEKQLGVKVKIVKFDSGKDVNTALAAGSIDVSELGSNPTALGIGNGLNYDVIYIGDIIGSAESLVVKNNANVNSVSQLKGKKIAVPFASTSHYSLLNALKQAGLKESDVKLLDLEPNDIHAAWKRGDIDAAYVWYPVLNNLVKDGKILTGSDKLAKQGIITADLVVARRDFAKSNKNLVVCYIKALNQANDLDQKNKEQSIKDIAEILNISESDAKFQRNGFEWIDGKKQLSKEYLGENIANVLKNTADFLKEQGSIKKSPTLKEYKDHVQTKYLKEALEK